MEDYWIWGASVVKGEDNKYQMFASRWPKKYPFFNGYIFYSEIVRAVSDKPEEPFEFQEVVLKPRGSNYWDGRMTHNPTIHKYGDTYLLFYIGTTYKGESPGTNSLQEPVSHEINWKISKPAKAYSRTISWDDGSTQNLGSFERPQLLIENGVPVCLYCANGDGPGGFNNATRTWNVATPLKLE